MLEKIRALREVAVARGQTLAALDDPQRFRFRPDAPVRLRNVLGTATRQTASESMR
jgi:hypothetical protein